MSAATQGGAAPGDRASAERVPDVSIVVPVHDEADFIPEGLPVLLDAVEDAVESAEVIIVENGSTDGTGQVCAAVAGDRAVVLSLAEADYGAAVRHGMLAARGHWVVMFDVDYFSQRFLEDLDGTADVIIASKRNPGSEDRRPPIRRLATLVFSLLLRSLLRSGVSDTHGIKAFSREIVDRHVPEVISRQDLFDTELVIRAERSGARIVEVPVVVEELRPARSSLVKRVPRTLRGLLRIRQVLSSAG